MGGWGWGGGACSPGSRGGAPKGPRERARACTHGAVGKRGGCVHAKHTRMHRQGTEVVGNRQSRQRCAPARMPHGGARTGAHCTGLPGDSCTRRPTPRRPTPARTSACVGARRVQACGSGRGPRASPTPPLIAPTTWRSACPTHCALRRPSPVGTPPATPIPPPATPFPASTPLSPPTHTHTPTRPH